MFSLLAGGTAITARDGGTATYKLTLAQTESQGAAKSGTSGWSPPLCEQGTGFHNGNVL